MAGEKGGLFTPFKDALMDNDEHQR